MSNLPSSPSEEHAERTQRLRDQDGARDRVNNIAANMNARGAPHVHLDTERTPFKIYEDETATAPGVKIVASYPLEDDEEDGMSTFSVEPNERENGGDGAADDPEDAHAETNALVNTQDDEENEDID